MNTFSVAGLAMGAAAIFGAGIYWSYRVQQKRREAIERLAAEMRWSFSPEGDDSLLSTLSGFHLFSQGQSQRLRNLMRGSMKDSKAEVFDYEYATGGGKHRHVHHFTVLHASVAGSPLPRFSLRPEHAFDKIGDRIGYKDIDFESFPEFSKRYFLRGTDEMGIRDLFGARLIQFFETNPGLCMEGESGTLILHRSRGHLKPEEIRGFVEKASQLLGFLTGR
jgi:hypothetical protein